MGAAIVRTAQNSLILSAFCTATDTCKVRVPDDEAGYTQDLRVTEVGGGPVPGRTQQGPLEGQPPRGGRVQGSDKKTPELRDCVNLMQESEVSLQLRPSLTPGCGPWHSMQPV